MPMMAIVTRSSTSVNPRFEPMVVQDMRNSFDLSGTRPSVAPKSPMTDDIANAIGGLFGKRERHVRVGLTDKFF
jgi:hypothetical protein